MSESPKKHPRLNIDGKWLVCQPAEDLGFFGNRLLCDFGGPAGQPTKKLLIRNLARSGSPPSSDVATRNVVIEQLPDANGLDLRSPVQKEYEYATPNDRGKYSATLCHLAEQDVSDLVSLKQAILAAAASGPAKHVWRLFYSACKALNEYGKKAGASGQVRLQCPSSLAVHGGDGKVIPLDAEVQEALLAGTEQEFFLKWFELPKGVRHASVEEASRLHSRALLLYFRYVLGYLQEKAQPSGEPTAPQLVLSQLTAIPRPNQLDDLLDWLKNFTGDWSLSADETRASPPIAKVVRPSAEAAAPAAPAGARGCSSLLALACSLLLNFILLPTVLVLGYLLWARHATALPAAPGAASPKEDVTNVVDVAKASPIDPSLRFASYDVIFPAHGTSRQKVHDAILHLFPDKIIAPKQGAEERRRLLKGQRETATEYIKNQAALGSFLERLAADHAVRFKGFAPEAPDKGIAAIIERGGLFTITVGGSKVKHGSLLQANGVELIAIQAGLEKAGADRTMLEQLRQATAEYASFEDALMIIGERPAFLLRVAPTPQAHEQVRRQLLEREGAPVFMPRPVLELFDAVDPADDTGGGIAKYTLKLEKKCIWRLVGKASRADADFENTPAKGKMRWTDVDAGETITWRPVSVARLNGQADVVATFDIAVILSEDRVVIFRNQSIMVGDSRAQVQKQCGTYLDRVLHFKIEAIDDGVGVGNQGEQFTGAFRYSYLADQAGAAADQGDNLQIMTLKEFHEQRGTEDKAVD